MKSSQQLYSLPDKLSLAYKLGFQPLSLNEIKKDFKDIERAQTLQPYCSDSDDSIKTDDILQSDYPVKPRKTPRLARPQSFEVIAQVQNVINKTSEERTVTFDKRLVDETMQLYEVIQHEFPKVWENEIKYEALEQKIQAYRNNYNIQKQKFMITKREQENYIKLFQGYLTRHGRITSIYSKRIRLLYDLLQCINTIDTTTLYHKQELSVLKHKLNGQVSDEMIGDNMETDDYKNKKIQLSQVESIDSKTSIDNSSSNYNNDKTTPVIRMKIPLSDDLSNCTQLVLYIGQVLMTPFGQVLYASLNEVIKWHINSSDDVSISTSPYITSSQSPTTTTTTPPPTPTPENLLRCLNITELNMLYYRWNTQETSLNVPKHIRQEMYTLFDTLTQKVRTLSPSTANIMVSDTSIAEKNNVVGTNDMSGNTENTMQMDEEVVEHKPLSQDSHTDLNLDELKKTSTAAAVSNTNDSISVQFVSSGASNNKENSDVTKKLRSKRDKSLSTTTTTTPTTNTHDNSHNTTTITTSTATGKSNYSTRTRAGQTNTSTTSTNTNTITENSHEENKSSPIETGETEDKMMSADTTDSSSDDPMNTDNLTGINTTNTNTTTTMTNTTNNDNDQNNTTTPTTLTTLTTTTTTAANTTAISSLADSRNNRINNDRGISKQQLKASDMILAFLPTEYIGEYLSRLPTEIKYNTSIYDTLTVDEIHAILARLSPQPNVTQNHTGINTATTTAAATTTTTTTTVMGSNNNTTTNQTTPIASQSSDHTCTLSTDTCIHDSILHFTEEKTPQSILRNRLNQLQQEYTKVSQLQHHLCMDGARYQHHISSMIQDVARIRVYTQSQRTLMRTRNPSYTGLKHYYHEHTAHSSSTFNKSNKHHSQQQYHHYSYSHLNNGNHSGSSTSASHVLPHNSSSNSNNNSQDANLQLLNMAAYAQEILDNSTSDTMNKHTSLLDYVKSSSPSSSSSTTHLYNTNNAITASNTHIGRRTRSNSYDYNATNNSLNNNISNANNTSVLTNASMEPYWKHDEYTNTTSIEDGSNHDSNVSHTQISSSNTTNKRKRGTKELLYSQSNNDTNHASNTTQESVSSTITTSNSMIETPNTETSPNKVTTTTTTATITINNSNNNSNNRQSTGSNRSNSNKKRSRR